MDGEHSSLLRGEINIRVYLAEKTSRCGCGRRVLPNRRPASQFQRSVKYYCRRHFHPPSDKHEPKQTRPLPLLPHISSIAPFGLPLLSFRLSPQFSCHPGGLPYLCRLTILGSHCYSIVLLDSSISPRRTPSSLAHKHSHLPTQSPIRNDHGTRGTHGHFRPD